MKREYIYVALIVGFFILLSTIFRPVIIPDSEDKCLKVEGVVSSINEGGVKDIAFRLKENSNLYYINRGLEQGLTLESLKDRLIGEPVTILYPKHTTLFGSEHSTNHLSVLKHKGEVIFTEIK